MAKWHFSLEREKRERVFPNLERSTLSHYIGQSFNFSQPPHTGYLSPTNCHSGEPSQGLNQVPLFFSTQSCKYLTIVTVNEVWGRFTVLYIDLSPSPKNFMTKIHENISKVITFLRLREQWFFLSDGKNYCPLVITGMFWEGVLYFYYSDFITHKLW